VLAVAVLGEDFAQVIVRPGQQGFEVEHLIQPLTGPGEFGGFSGQRWLTAMAEAKEQPVHEVVEHLPRTPALPVPVRGDAVERGFEHPAGGRTRLPFYDRNRADDATGHHGLMPVCPTSPQRVFGEEQQRKKPPVLQF